MLICLWKGCEFVSADLAAFQEHLINIHAPQQEKPQQQQQQKQQLNLDKQNGGTEAVMVEEGPMAKKAKLNMLDKDKMINRGGKRQKSNKKLWVDVLGFIRRIQLARSVCLINCKIYEICWPRLHGNKVVVAPQVGEIIIASRDELGKHPGALLLKDRKEVPFPECPPPDYIHLFSHIEINFLDHQVLAFLSLIVPIIARNKNGVGINFAMKMSNLDENQRASVNRLLQFFREKITTIVGIQFSDNLSSLQFLPDVDNKMKRMEANYSWRSREELDPIPIIIQYLASKRADGQQRVMKIDLREKQEPTTRKLLDAIKEEFRTATQPLPQPFFLKIFTWRNFNIPQSEEHNPQTDETLSIAPYVGDGIFGICRHPRGQVEQWAENASSRLHDQLPINKCLTYINVNMSEFGVSHNSVPISMD